MTHTLSNQPIAKLRLFFSFCDQGGMKSEVNHDFQRKRLISRRALNADRPCQERQCFEICRCSARNKTSPDEKAKIIPLTIQAPGTNK